MKIDMCSFAGYKSLDGSNLRVYHLVNELLKRGSDVRFIVPGKEHAESCRERFGTDAVDAGLEIDRFSKSRLKLYPRFAWRASKKVDKNADIVFGQSLPAALAVRLSKTAGKKVVDYVDIWSEYWIYAHPGARGRMVYRVVRRAEGFSLHVDTVLTITKKIRGMLIDRGCDPGKIRIVRDGVDTKMFRPLRAKQGFYGKYGLEKSETHIIYQGGIAAHDGVQFLVDAAPLVLKEFPDVKFLIVGRGDYMESVRKKVQDKGLDRNFIFTGWVPYQEMPQFMNVSRINAVPIPDAPATQGVVTLKLFEAMACGIPTVIGDLPGVREHIKHKETGYLARAEDKGRLAEAMIRLLNDKKLYSRIKRNGLKMIPRYDWRLIAGDIADVILGS